MLITRGGDFFERAISAGFSESLSSTIDLPEEDPDVVSRMLHFIYTGDYLSHSPSKGSQPAIFDSSVPGGPNNTYQADTKSKSDDSDKDWIQSWDLKQILLHVHMFAAAVKFGISSLQAFSRECFANDFVKRLGLVHWDVAPQGTITDVIDAVYNTTPSDERDLRDLCVVEGVVEFQTRAEDSETTHTSVNLLNAIRNIPDFAVDMTTYRFEMIPYDDEAVLYLCEACDQDSKRLVFPCLCNQWFFPCRETGCEESRYARSICTECWAKGSLKETSY